MSTWFRVHDSIVEHPKFVGLNAEAWTLWIHGASYASRNLTDGAIPKAIINRLAPIKSATKTAAMLVDAGVWEATPEGWQIHDWADHQRTAEDVAEHRKTRAERGTLGNHKRWHTAKGKHDPECPHCIAESSLNDRSVRQVSDSDRIAKPIPNTIAGESLSDRRAIAESESESESELLKSSRQLTVVSDSPSDDDERIKLVADILGEQDYRRAVADRIKINHHERFRAAAKANRITDAANAVRRAKPDDSPETIAAKVAGTAPIPASESDAVRDTRRGPDTCPDCQGTGWITPDESGDATVCRTCQGAA